MLLSLTFEFKSAGADVKFSNTAYQRTNTAIKGTEKGSDLCTNMSSSSDSEDENLKLIIEAADTSLLSDSLFNTHEDQPSLPATELQKSQRHLNDDYNGTDFIPSEAVQKFMSKKLANLVKEQVEFITNADVNGNSKKKPKRKSRVRLLNDFQCYVKTYEDFEYEEVGPGQKPIIKRRVVDADELDEESKLKSVSVDGNFILSGKETDFWSKKSKGKVLCYKSGKGNNKAQHLIETENEFSKLRRKNRWNESKIKTTKFSIK